MRDPKTLQQAIQFFSEIDNSIEWLAAQRWRDGKVICPTCGSDSVDYVAKRRIWECRTKHPRKQFSIKVGTIFEDSPIGLDKWLLATWMVTNCKNGVSSYEIHRAIGVTQKSAWFMLHRIRLAMQGDVVESFGGEVEVDETYIGGAARSMHKDRRKKSFHGGEQAFRLNERECNDGQRFKTVINQIINKRVTFKELTGRWEPRSTMWA